MVFPYVINANDRCALVTLSGTVTGADIARTIEAIYCDAQWQTGFDTIWNGAAATNFIIDNHDRSTFAALQYRYPAARGGRDILVVPRTAEFNTARRYALEIGGGPREVHVVRVEAEANHILGRHLRPGPPCKN